MQPKPRHVPVEAVAPPTCQRTGICRCKRFVATRDSCGPDGSTHAPLELRAFEECVMRTGTAVFVLLLISAVAQAQTTSTTTGTFSLTDPDNVLGQGSVSLTATNATYAATATFDSATPTQIDAIHFAASPNGTGSTFSFDFSNGSTAIAAGSFTVDGINSNASVTFTDGTN